MRILLTAGAEPTAQDAQNRTALHIASMANDVELVKVSYVCPCLLTGVLNIFFLDNWCTVCMCCIRKHFEFFYSIIFFFVLLIHFLFAKILNRLFLMREWM